MREVLSGGRRAVHALRGGSPHASCFPWVRLAVGVLHAQPDEDAADAEKKPQSKAFQAMFERAKAARVSPKTGRSLLIGLLAEPLMHFSDPEINILDGRLWAWSDGGRPQARMKSSARMGRRRTATGHLG